MHLQILLAEEGESCTPGRHQQLVISNACAKQDVHPGVSWLAGGEYRMYASSHAINKVPFKTVLFAAYESWPSDAQLGLHIKPTESALM